MALMGGEPPGASRSSAARGEPLGSKPPGGQVSVKGVSLLCLTLARPTLFDTVCSSVLCQQRGSARKCAGKCALSGKGLCSVRKCALSFVAYEASSVASALAILPAAGLLRKLLAPEAVAAARPTGDHSGSQIRESACSVRKCVRSVLCQDGSVRKVLCQERGSARNALCRGFGGRGANQLSGRPGRGKCAGSVSGSVVCQEVVCQEVCSARKCALPGRGCARLRQYKRRSCCAVRRDCACGHARACGCIGKTFSRMRIWLIRSL